MSEHKKLLAICVDSSDYETSLILRMIKEIAGGQSETLTTRSTAYATTPGFISWHLPHFIGGMVFSPLSWYLGRNHYEET